jgi:hypothetical protein
MTSLTQYQRFEKDGYDFYIDVEGSVSATQTGLALFCGVSKQSVSKWTSVNQIKCINAKVIGTYGERSVNQIQSVTLYDEDTIADALEHFNPDRSRLFRKIGVRAYCQKIVGWVQPKIGEVSEELRVKQFEAAYYVSMYNITQFGKLAKLDMEDHFREMAEQKRSITRLADSIDLDIYMKTPAYPYRKQLDAINKILLKHNYLEGFPEIKAIAPLMAILSQLAKLENQFGFPLPSVMVDDAKFAINSPDLIFENIKNLGSLEGLGSNTIKGRAVIARLTASN